MEINIWSVIVATVVAFVIGAIWYSPILFGKEWMSLIGHSQKEVDDFKKKGVIKFYVIQLVVTFITFCVLGFAMTALSTKTGSDGAFIGVLAWLGFILPISVGAIIWERRPFKLVLIDNVNMLLSLVVGGAIIGAW